MDTSKKIEIIKYKDGISTFVEDEIIIEFPLTLYIKGEQYATLLCTPRDEKELVVGYLFSENIIKSYNDIKSLSVDLKSGEAFVEIEDLNLLGNELNKKRLITSGCANNTVFYNAVDKIKLRNSKHTDKLSINMEALLDIMMNMNKSSKLFLETGGVHMSLLSDLKDFMVFREDIGRHNAIDKIVGHIVINDIDVSDKVLFSSGRLSSEMVLKCAKAGINLIVSKSAPMDMAIRIANELGIVLIGFARGKRCNIYTAFNRLNL